MHNMNRKLYINISAEKLATHSNLVSLPGIYFTLKYARIQCVLIFFLKREKKKTKTGLNNSDIN